MNCQSFPMECSVEQWTFHTAEVKAVKAFPTLGLNPVNRETFFHLTLVVLWYIYFQIQL